MPAQTAQGITGSFGLPFHGRAGDFISRNGPLLEAILAPTPQNRCYLAEIGHCSSPFFASQSQDWCYLAELGHCSGPFCVTVGNDVHPVEQVSTLDRAVLASRARGAASFHGARGGELPLGSRLFGPGRECGPGAEGVAHDVAAVGCVTVVRAVTVALRREAPRRSAAAIAHAADGDAASLVVGPRPRALSLVPGRALRTPRAVRVRGVL